MNEKTRVSLNIVNFLLLAGFIITAVFTYASSTSVTESRLSNVEIAIEQEAIERKAEDLEIKEEQQANRALLIEQQTSLAEIKTDLKWIRAALED